MRSAMKMSSANSRYFGLMKTLERKNTIRKRVNIELQALLYLSGRIHEDTDFNITLDHAQHC
jgi:hypothetical protein